MSSIHARHVTRLFRAATPAQSAEGTAWYAVAYREAVLIASVTGLSVDAAAGLIAALSPQLSWDRNVRVAWDMASGIKPTGVLGANVRKGARILAGEDAASVLGGLKVRAFWQGILTAGATDEVCVDRHAIDAALGRKHNDATRPALTPKRYAAFADAYVRAARILRREGMDVTAAQVQAVVWVVWRTDHAWRRAA